MWGGLALTLVMEASHLIWRAATTCNGHHHESFRNAATDQ